MSMRSCLYATAVLVAGGMVLPGQTGVEDLRVPVGKSIVIDYPSDIGRISTSNPDIVDAVAVSTREILLHAKNLGAATVVVWAKAGQRNFYGITVEHNLAPLRKVLKETFPDEDINIQSARDSITLTGRVSSPEVSDRAAALVASAAKTVVNNLHFLPGEIEKQVLLRVKFAELDRDATSQFGLNLASLGTGNTIGRISTGQFQPPNPDRVSAAATEFSITDALNIFAFRPDLNLAGFIKLLETQSLLQILAEPNLVTTNGKEASFLVGGEFPVPVLQGGSNAGSVTIQFREFGIRLAFNPKLTENNTIKMYVRPEVSTIDLTNAVSFSGFTIPALATRRMETNIELAEGQSFVIAGLLDDRARATFNHIPGLANIPILGELFKSREKKRSKTELLVMVTPEIVRPIGAGEARPEIPMPMRFLENFKPGDTITYDGKIKSKED
ncbi:MAG: pilus assembly protein N-terminal domain-containing protein [Bryobacteraceae bacterium]|nr:pilus assembly protein N-terminal domain-containing protein [Bryobacteraceae bacterium]